jgi:hypothetical protein
MLTGNATPTIQMVTSDGFCSTATMNTVKKDDGMRYSAQLKYGRRWPRRGGKAC